VLDRDPVWSPLRGDPRFRAIADRVHAHVRAEREALERMRASGEVPRRPRTAATLPTTAAAGRIPADATPAAMTTAK
jgi:hypothetical protein